MNAFNSFWKIFRRFIPYLLIVIFAVILYVSFSQQDSNTISTSILNGIISGIVTALIIFVATVIWRKNVLIWIENLLYQDVCIEGEWEGFIIPYLGLEDLDKIAKNHAWNQFKKKLAEEQMSRLQKGKINKETSASVIDDASGKEEKISAEIILRNNKEVEEKEDKIIIEIGISPQPIIIRAEINRIGHKVTGRILEIGGVSKIHSYNISGSFKNLILSCNYETNSKDNIDRGAMSLMLIENGNRFEGFFSSYNDIEHKISPMLCSLRKRNQTSV